MTDFSVLFLRRGKGKAPPVHFCSDLLSLHGLGGPQVSGGKWRQSLPLPASTACGYPGPQPGHGAEVGVPGRE